MLFLDPPPQPLSFSVTCVVSLGLPLLSLAFSWSISLSSCFRSLYSPPLPPSPALSFCAFLSACLSSLSSYLSTYLYLCVLSHCAGVHGVSVCACWFVTTIAPFIPRGLMLDAFWLGLGCANAVKLKGIACSNSLSSKNNLIVMTSTAGAARFGFVLYFIFFTVYIFFFSEFVFA